MLIDLDRGEVAAGQGVMNWYLLGNDLLRNSYLAPAGTPVAGQTGNRDFSGKLKVGGTRVSPAPASSFTIPKGCTPGPTIEASEVFKPFDIFGDRE
jgi:hypothetical protein